MSRPIRFVSFVSIVLVALAPACLPSFDGDDDDDDEEEADCGDGDRQRGEACDGEDLRGETCEVQGFGPGTLTCLATCEFDRQGCGAPESCGDDVRDGVEVCDGADLVGETCEGLGYGPGVLGCASNCGNFDVAACAPPDGCEPACGDRVCGLDPVCGTSCGACANGFACNEGACEVVPRCTEPDDLVDICEAGVCTLDLDVALFDIRTQLRVDGDAPIDLGTDFFETSARFTDTSSGVAYFFGFDATGGRESFLVPAGRFDVDIFVNNSSAVPGAPTNVPLRARENVVVEADGNLDLDVALFDIRTQLRVDGDAPIDLGTDFFETSARFTDISSGVAYFFGFDATGGRESFLVPAGTFDVDIFVNNSSGVPGAPTSVPLRSRENVAIAADGNLDLDVALFDLRTQLRVDGDAPIDLGTDFFETSARFTDVVTGVAYFFGFDATGGRESFLVPAGTFDIDIFVNNSSGVPGAPTSVPLRSRADVVVAADGNLDLDVALFDLRTQLRVDGDAPIDLGTDFFETSARFTDVVTGVAYFFGFDATGGRESFLVPAGTFDIDIFVNNSSGVPGAPTSVPLRARADVVVAADGNLDLDVALFDVRTQLRVDGSAPVDLGTDFFETSARFTDVATGVAYFFGFDATGGRESFLIPAGTFDVDLFVNNSSGVPGAPTNVPLRARGDVVIDADRDLDLDVALFEVRTQLRVDGTAPIDLGTDFFETSARFTDVATGVAYFFGFDATGGRETFLVPAGTFDVDIFVNNSSAVPGAPTNVPLRAIECIVVAE